MIPVVSIGVLKEVEKTMVENLKSNLELSSNLVSLQLSLNPEWFNEVQLPSNDEFIAKELFVFPLNDEVEPDGFLAEWQPIEKFRQAFKVESDVAKNQISLLLGSYDDSLYLSLKVLDDNVIYAKHNAGYSSDTLVISFLDNQNMPRRVFASPVDSGIISVKKYFDKSIITDPMFRAAWEETVDGFNFEMAFPKGLKPKELRVTHFDVENLMKETHKDRVSTSGIELNPLVWPSNSIDEFVNKIELRAGQRLWVLDEQGRVIARKGDLIHINVEQHNLVSRFSEWLLSSENKIISDRRDASMLLSSPVVYDALKGRESSAIESVGGTRFSVALVASPIRSSDEVIGAVFIEENIVNNQLLQRKNFSSMIGWVLIIICVIIVLVIWYITRVSSRITKLQKSINKVVDDDGRINSPLQLKRIDGDEIDDLSNAFSDMGAKLFDYNDYLEKLASRLSHELRTPIAIVSSSLDNLMLNTDDEMSKVTIQRALVGTQRLGEIISRMRQASGVKNAMQTAQFEEIDFCHMLVQLVDGFSQSFPDKKFRFESSHLKIMCSISTDLMAELLDKLLSNAMDFAKENSTIVVALKRTESRLTLSVTNKGVTIAKKDQRKIFQSLVSIRNNKTSQTPNLGLGLYVVKLIANFHKAKVKVGNLNDKSGVKFSVIWKA